MIRGEEGGECLGLEIWRRKYYMFVCAEESWLGIDVYYLSVIFRLDVFVFVSCFWGLFLLGMIIFLLGGGCGGVGKIFVVLCVFIFLIIKFGSKVLKYWVDVL